MSEEHKNQTAVRTSDTPEGAASRFLRNFVYYIYPAKLWEFLLLGVLVVVVGVLIDWAYFTAPEIIMEDVKIPKKFEKYGFSGHFLASQIADEIRNIQRVGRTSKQPINTETIQLKPDVEVRATVFTLGSIVSFVRSSVGRGDHVISASLYCANEAKPVLALQGSYAHEGALPEDVAHVHILRKRIFLDDGEILRSVHRQSVCSCQTRSNLSMRRQGAD
jgi:hypothetical protein